MARTALGLALWSCGRSLAPPLALLLAGCGLGARAEQDSSGVAVVLQEIERLEGRADWAGARRLAEACTEREPRALGCWQALARCAEQERNLGLVLQAEEHLMHLSSEPALHARRAFEFAAHLGEWDQAEAAVELLERLDPGGAPSLLARGRLAQEHGDAVRARACFEALLQLRPQSPEAHYALACLASDAGDTREASARVQHALESDPGHLASLTLQATLLLQNGAAAEGERALARRRLVESISAQEFHAQPPTWRLAQLELAQGLLADWAPLWRAEAQVRIELGELGRARAALERARAARPRDPALEAQLAAAAEPVARREPRANAR